MESSTGITNFSHLSDNDSERDMCKHCGGECVTDGIFCENCHKWSHRKCAKLSVKVYNKLSNSNKPYYCADCKDVCKHCDGDCITDGIFCENCYKWSHRKCAKLSVKVYNILSNSNKPYYCADCKKSFYCNECTKYCRINQKSVKCSICSIFVHKKCTPLTGAQYDNIKKSPNEYFCLKCIKENLPFGESPDTEDLTPLTYDSENCILCCECNTECNECESCLDPHRMCSACNDCIYHDYESLSNKFCIRQEKGLSLMHFNTRSLMKKENFSKLHDIVTNLPNEPDIICISETKLKQSQNQLNDADSGLFHHDDISIPNYVLVCNHSETKAGGTGIYIKKTLRYNPLPDLKPDFDGCEGNFIEIVTGPKAKNILIGAVYRHPHDNYKSFSKYINDTIGTIVTKFDIILMGDINIDITASSKSYRKYGKEYLDLLASYGLRNLINKPTRVIDTCQTIIDHFVTNLPISHVDAGILVNNMTDHFPIFGVIHTDIGKRKNVPIFKRVLSEHKQNIFQEKLRENIANVSFQAQDPNDCVAKIMKIVSETVNSIFPLRKLSRKEKRREEKPWMTPFLIKSSKRRKVLYRESMRKKDPESKEKYRKYKNQLNHLIEKAEDDFNKENFLKAQGDSGKTWRTANEILGKTKKENEMPSEIIDNDIILKKPRDIVNKLNRSFVSKGPTLASKVRPSNRSVKDFLGPSVKNTFKFNLISCTEIIDIVREFVTKKSTGHDGISAKILKWSIHIISPFLRDIFNKCMNMGVYPDEFKIARVVALHKTGAKNSADNYRPISILTQLNKVFEKLIHSRLMKFLDEENILTPKQFGYRKKT